MSTGTRVNASAVIEGMRRCVVNRIGDAGPAGVPEPTDPRLYLVGHVGGRHPAVLRKADVDQRWWAERTIPGVLALCHEALTYSRGYAPCRIVGVALYTISQGSHEIIAVDGLGDPYQVIVARDYYRAGVDEQHIDGYDSRSDVWQYLRLIMLALREQHDAKCEDTKCREWA